MIDTGIHRIPMADYLADPCEEPSLSSGCAYRLVDESPFHAWASHPRLGGRRQDFSAASDTGSIRHDLLLGGEGKICEINPADYRSKPTKADPEGSIPKGWTNDAIRAARDEARANGLVPMLAGDLIGERIAVKAAREYIAGDKVLRKAFGSGESELTVISREGPTWVRTRPDWLNLEAGISVSFKTTLGRVQPRQFARMASSMGYCFAQSFYERCLTQAGHPGVRHIILAQEQKFPFACAWFEEAPAMAAIERSRVSRAIALWQECVATGVWAGYSGPYRIEPTPWQLAEEEERLQAEELERMEA